MKWTPTGKIYLWTDARHGKQGYSLSADKEGCQCLLSIPDVIPRVLDWGVTVKLGRVLPSLFSSGLIPFAKTDKVKRFSSLVIGLDLRQAYPIWIRPSDKSFDECTIVFSPSGISDFRRGVKDIMMGEGDWCITSGDDGPNESSSLWFWPLRWSWESRGNP